MTGVVTVAPCASPGEIPCIDYEQKRKYTLTASATDNKGAEDGRTRSVQLIIDIVDENDVPPAIEALYERYILENEQVTINPLRIDVSMIRRHPWSKLPLPLIAELLVHCSSLRGS